MEKRAVDLLKKIVETPSPSGFEQPVQKILRAEMKKCCDEVTTDVHGNLTGVVNPKAKLRVMLSGHADELGFIIKSIDDKGFIRFDGLGGWDASHAVGQRVIIYNERGPVHGVLGKKPIHLLSGDEGGKAPSLDQLWIDIGAKDKKDAEKVVTVGDPAVLDAKFQLLRNGLAAARGFDDRVGSFIVLETLRALQKSKLAVAVYGVSSVQEELGLRGAKTAAFGIDPHVGIAIDVAHASDYPTIDAGKVGDIQLGKGPVLHRGANINPVVGKMLETTGKKNKIPTQLKIAPGPTGTDANAIQINAAGVATALIGVPNRHMHSPVEMVALKDVENSVKLLVAFLHGLKANADFTP